MWNELVNWWNGVEEDAPHQTRPRSRSVGMGNTTTSNTSGPRRRSFHTKHNIAPWDQVPQHWVGREKELKEYIMSIPLRILESYEIDVPKEFHFDMKNEFNFHMASAALKQDKNLAKTLIQFTSENREEELWRMYFYCVKVIKETKQLPTLQGKLKNIFENSKHRKDQESLKEVIGKEFKKVTEQVHKTMDMMETYNKYKVHERLGAKPEDIPDNKPKASDIHFEMQRCIEGKKKISLFLGEIHDESFILAIDFKDDFSKLMTRFEQFQKLSFKPKETERYISFSPTLYGVNEETTEREEIKSQTTTEYVRKHICMHLPIRFQHSDWLLLYSTAANGYSLHTLYSKCDKEGPALVICRTTKNQMLGFYHGSGFKCDKRSYYGSGESFVFAAAPQPNSKKFDFHYYGWTKRNQYFALTDPNYMCFGGGDAAALRFDGSLQHGTTSSCQTFASPPLLSLNDKEDDQLSNDGDFDIVGVEVWKFTHSKGQL